MKIHYIFSVKHASVREPIQSVIDTHCHVLPGIDDGAYDEEETLEICRMALEDGIHTIVATPHSFDGQYVNLPDRVIQLTGRINDLLAVCNVPLTVLPGMELRIVPELLDLLKQGSVLTLNEHKYVLLEFHPSQLPAGFEFLVQKVVDEGYGLILAHPEKNQGIQNSPDYLYTLLKRFEPWDVLVQITAGSLTGRNGHRASRTSRILLENNLGHLIASDAHDSTVRPPGLSSAVRACTKIVGQERAKLMVGAIPEAVLGRGPFPDYWEPRSPRRWWRIR